MPLHATILNAFLTIYLCMKPLCLVWNICDTILLCYSSKFSQICVCSKWLFIPRFRFHSFVLTLSNHVNRFQPFLLVFWLFDYLLEKFCEVYARVWYLLRPCLVKNNPEKKTQNVYKIKEKVTNKKSQTWQTHV